MRGLAGRAHTVWVPAKLRFVFAVLRYAATSPVPEVAAVRSNLLLVDAGIAALAAIVVLILAPGLAVVAIIALVVLVVCAISLLVGRLRSRAQRRSVRSRPRLR